MRLSTIIMNGKVFLLLALQVLLGFASLAVCQSANFDANLTCSADACSANVQISEFGEMLSVNSSSACGSCVLHLNTSNQHGINLHVAPLQNRKQFHYIYATDVYGETISLTGNAVDCSIMFPTNRIEIKSKMDATLMITTTPLTFDLDNGCSTNDSMPCKAISNCTEIVNVGDVFEVSYQLGATTYEVDYFTNEFYNQVGKNDFEGELPPCPSQCVCRLDYQQYMTRCNGKLTHILLLHPELEVQQFVPPLKVLDASNRQLESVGGRSFADLEYINRLILSKNLLTHIDSGTFHWKGLHILELADNKLTELQADLFQNLVFVLFLDLRGNQLTSLHASLFVAQRSFLVAVYLSRNNLTELPSETFKDLRMLNVLLLDHNNITSVKPGVLQDLKQLWWLDLDDNKLSMILPGTFSGPDLFARINLSGNRLKTIDSDMFAGATGVIELSLSRNELSTLSSAVFSNTPTLKQLSLDNNYLEEIDLKAFTNLPDLLHLNISGNNIKSISSVQHSTAMSSKDDNQDTNKTVLFPKLIFFEASDNKVERIDANVFMEMPVILSVALRRNPLKRVDKSTFKPLANNDTVVFVDEPATCCFIDSAKCGPKNQKEPYLTCLRLLPFTFLRAFMWIFGLFAFIGNLSVLVWRCMKRGRENVVQVLLIENLALSDLLMGVYMLIIASADLYYQQYFPSESDAWRNGLVCKVAGALSVLSSEGSVFIVTLISIDRLISIKYPTHPEKRLTKKSALITLICLWCFAAFLSIIPTSFSGLNPDFYDVSEVCIGLPFVRAPVFFNESVVDVDFESFTFISSERGTTVEEYYIYPESGNDPGLFFSIVLFLGINFLCFLTVLICYIYIFVLYKQSTGRSGSSSRDQEITLAIRMGAIVLTDFACWTPIMVIGILVQSAVVTISPVVYVYIVVFILPINSVVNPYIYTVAILVSDYRASRARSRSQKQQEMTERKATDSGLGGSAGSNGTNSNAARVSSENSSSYGMSSNAALVPDDKIAV